MSLFLLFAIYAVSAVPQNKAEEVQRRQVQIGERVTLDCNITYYNEITWMRIATGTALRVVLVARLTDTGFVKLIYRGGNFSAATQGRSIALIIDNISEKDFSTYYCVSTAEKILQIGNGVQLYRNAPDNEDMLFHQNLTKKAEGVLEESGLNQESSVYYLIYAVVLGIGQMLLFLAVVAVSIKTRKRHEAQ